MLKLILKRELCNYHKAPLMFIVYNVFMYVSKQNQFYFYKIKLYYQYYYYHYHLILLLLFIIIIFIISGGAGGIASRGQIYMGTPIGVVEIYLQAKLLPSPLKVPPPHPPFAPPLFIIIIIIYYY